MRGLTYSFVQHTPCCRQWYDPYAGRIPTEERQGSRPARAGAHGTGPAGPELTPRQRGWGLEPPAAPPAAPITPAAPPLPVPASAPESAHPPAPALRVRSEAEIYADLQRVPRP